MMKLKQAKEPTGNALYVMLKKQIRDAKLKPGDRILSSRELRTEFGVSYRATLRAMQRLAQEGYVVRQAGSGTFVRPLPDEAVLQSHRRRIKVVLSLESADDVFMRPMISALQAQLDALECSWSMVAKTQEEACEVFVRGEADAFIWVCPSLATVVRPTDAPVVLLGQDLELVWSEGDCYDIVTADSRQGGALAARFLREQGCRQVALVGVQRRNELRTCPITQARFNGFEAAWGDAIFPSSVFLGETYMGMVGAQLAGKILDAGKLPDAVFAASDELASGVCHALAGRGIQVGRDIRVVGFDGQPCRNGAEHQLTSIAAPLEALGRTAAWLALQRSADPGSIARRVTLACSLRKGFSG